MIRKYWRKIGLFILILACLFNIIGKLVSIVPIKEQLKASVEYIQNNQKNK